MFEQERERDGGADEEDVALPATTPNTRTASLEEFIEEDNQHPTAQTGSAVITDVVYHETEVPWYDYAVITFSFRDETSMTRRFPIYEDGSMDDDLAELLDYLDISEENRYSAAYETTGKRVPAFSDGKRWFIYLPPSKSLGSDTVLEIFESRLFNGKEDGVYLSKWVPLATAAAAIAAGTVFAGTLGVALFTLFTSVFLFSGALSQFGVPGTIF